MAGAPRRGRASHGGRRRAGSGGALRLLVLSVGSAGLLCCLAGRLTAWEDPLPALLRPGCAVRSWRHARVARTCYRRPCWWRDGITDVATGAQWLRSACGRNRKKVSVQEIDDYLSSLERHEALEVVRGTNGNGKAPIHMAAQMRWSAQVPDLIEVLVRHGANVSVATVRGFTPLLYAALRGHNSSVRTLLRHGATPRVVTVNNMSPAAIGQERLDSETQSLLRRAEAEAAHDWRDFRGDPAALEAHARHQARMSGEQQSAAEAEQWRELDVEDRVAELVPKLRDALEAGNDAASLLLVESSIRELKYTKGRKSPIAVLSSVFSQILHGSRTMLRRVLSACREEALGKALGSLEKRDRTPIRVVLGALLEQLAEAPDQLDLLSVETVAEVANQNLALEVLLLKRNLCASDGPSVEALWRDVLSSGASVDCFTPEVTTVVGLRVTRDRGGMVVAEWARLLHWACAMRAVAPSWADMVGEVVSRASASRRAGHLLDAIASPGPDVPQAVAARLELPKRAMDMLRAAAQDEACDASGKATAQGDSPAGADSVAQLASDPSLAALPMYEPGMPWAWVPPDEGAVLAVHEQLKALLASHSGSRRLPLAIDTEWGASSTSSRGPLAVVQLATSGRAWVLDAASPTPALKALLKGVLYSDRALRLGFSFAQDMARLLCLVSGVAGASDRRGAAPPPTWRPSVVDLQARAVARGGPELRSRPPGLKAVAETWLGRTLDKSQQRSDWDARPLAAAQLRYAAADAAVLLDIAAAMSIDGTSRP